MSGLRLWLILLGLTLGVCVTNGFARFAYGLILPAMREDLGWSYAQAGWINTANALGYLIGAMATLALIGRVPPSRLFSIGVLGTSVFLLATGFTSDFWAQTLWRVLTGICGASAFIAGGALSAALFGDDPKRNAFAIALYYGLGGGAGMVLSGAALPAMFEAYGAVSWPWAWGLMGGISLLFCPLCIWAGETLRPPIKQANVRAELPARAMLPELLGYLAFGLGYIVYLTFLVAWMKTQSAGPLMVSVVWVIAGVGVALSPFVWRAVLGRYSSGRPLAMILFVLALGTALPVALPGTVGLVLSGAMFGVSVFMAPSAVTSFSRRNLPQASWGAAVSLFTVVFAAGQTIGPIAAGFLGDVTGDIGLSLLCAGGILLLGAVIATMQRPLEEAA